MAASGATQFPNRGGGALKFDQSRENKNLRFYHSGSSDGGAERGELNLGGLDRGESDADFLIHYSNRFLSFNSHNMQSFGARRCLSPSPRSTLALCSIRALMKQLSAVKTSRRHSCCKNAGPRVPLKKKKKTPHTGAQMERHMYAHATHADSRPQGQETFPRRGEASGCLFEEGKRSSARST